MYNLYLKYLFFKIRLSCKLDHFIYKHFGKDFYYSFCEQQCKLIYKFINKACGYDVDFLEFVPTYDNQDNICDKMFTTVLFTKKFEEVMIKLGKLSFDCSMHLYYKEMEEIYDKTKK